MQRTLLLLSTLGALMLAACGGDSDDRRSPTPGGSPTAAATATVTALPTASATRAPATFAPTSVPQTPGPLDERARITLIARDHLVGWLGPVVDPSAIMLLGSDRLTWRNGCLQVDRFGVACTQALTEGYMVVFAVGDATYEVRTDVLGGLVLWAPETEALVRFAEAGPNAIQFTTDDGRMLLTQPVPGTSYGVSVQSLKPGDRVGIAVVDAPQSGGLLLVWLDPAP